jgi:hypothetical protein
MMLIRYHIEGAQYRGLGWNVTRHLGNRKHVIFCHRVRGSVRAVRAVWNTNVFLTATRVVADGSPVYTDRGALHFLGNYLAKLVSITIAYVDPNITGKTVGEKNAELLSW